MRGNPHDRLVEFTFDLPEDLAKALDRVAASEGRSREELVVEAIRAAIGAPSRPTVPIRSEGLGLQDTARRVDELLDGFGER